MRPPGQLRRRARARICPERTSRRGRPVPGHRLPARSHGRTVARSQDGSCGIPTACSKPNTFSSRPSWPRCPEVDVLSGHVRSCGQMLTPLEGTSCRGGSARSEETTCRAWSSGLAEGHVTDQNTQAPDVRPRRLHPAAQAHPAGVTVTAGQAHQPAADRSGRSSALSCSNAVGVGRCGRQSLIC